MTERDRDNLLVVAIDIGTTYSGYAFSKRYTFKTDPLNIRVNLPWYPGSGRSLLTSKTPTCILLNSDKEFVSFGYEAENQYADLVMNKQQQDFYYFPRFMTSLHNDKNLSRSMMIEDFIGKPVLAIDVIALLIRALADHAMTAMETQGTRVYTTDKLITWVLTVPAIWTDNSDNFMIDCAEKAGIQQNHLLLIKQQEAALIYCHHLPLNKAGDAELSGEDTKCMLVDLGGATVDISVLGKLVQGGVEELYRITRGDCGGTSVDNGFIQLFENMLGKHLLNTMEREHFKDYLDLLTGLEAYKRTFTADNEISITVPNKTLDSLCIRHLQKDFSTVLESTYSNSISILFNKMRIDKELSKSIFDKAINSILKILQELFALFDFQTAELIFLVGGFSECKLVQGAIMDAFPEKTILVSEKTDFATLKGAVLYGHNNEKRSELPTNVSTQPFGEDIIDNFDFTKRSPPPLFVEGLEELPTNVSFEPFGEDIIDNFDFTKRSPPPLFIEDLEGNFSPGISNTAKETCETVLIGFEMTTTDIILRHGDIAMARFSNTVNAATMKKHIERNKRHWVGKETLEALRLRQVYELLHAFKDNNYTEILKYYYRLQHEHTLNTIKEPLEIPVYIHRCVLKNEWIRAVENAITSINEVTPGINLHETEDIIRSQIQIGVHKSEESKQAYTMYGSIDSEKLSTEYMPFIHLGSEWDVNQMKGTSIHELMHALGFHHEMQRFDREMYLDVVNKDDHNYHKNTYKILTRFDPFSVMLYPEDHDMLRKEGDPIWNLKKTQVQCQELSELNKIALNLKFKPCTNNYINYWPQLSKHTGMLYCGRPVMLTHNQVGKATTDGFCGPDNWANCPACRVIIRIKDKVNQSKEIQKLMECLQKGKWQGLSGLFYCGNKDEKFKTDLKHVETDGICGPDTGIPCTDCGNELYKGYSIKSWEQKRRCVLQ